MAAGGAAGAELPRLAAARAPAAPDAGAADETGGRTETRDEGAGGSELRPIPPISPTRQVSPKVETAASDAATGPPEGAETAEKPEVERALDDFEGRLTWQPVAWENANDCDISLVRNDEGQALSLTCKPGEKEKGGAVLQLGTADLSAFKVLLLDVKVEGKDPVAMAVAFQTSAYFESVRREMAPGWNREVAFPLATSDYKTSPDWQHNSPLKGLSSVRSIFLVVYSADERQVLVDNVRLLREPKTPPAADPPAGPVGAATGQ